MKYYKLLFLASTLFLSLGFIFNPEHSYASNGFFEDVSRRTYTITTLGTDLGWEFQSSVNKTISSGQKVGEIYNPGDTFTLNVGGTVNIGSCNNQAVSGGIYIKNIVNATSSVVGTNATTSEGYVDWNYHVNSFALNKSYTFVAPSVPGQYRIYFETYERNDHYYWEWNGWGWVPVWNTSQYSGVYDKWNYYEFTVVNSVPVLSCGLATSTPSLSFPSSNLCGAGNTTSNQATSTDNNPHTWSCSVGGTSTTTTCSTYRCATGNKYCATTNSCISNASCCGSGAGGTCLASQVCVVGGGLGTCENIAPTCSPLSLTPTVSPTFVANPSLTCTLKWNVNSTLQSGTGSCTAGIKCYVDNTNQTTSSSTGVSLPVGTHSLSCGSDLTGTSTVSVKCRVSPGYGEF